MLTENAEKLCKGVLLCLSIQNPLLGETALPLPSPTPCSVGGAVNPRIGTLFEPQGGHMPISREWPRGGHMAKLGLSDFPTGISYINNRGEDPFPVL